MSTCNQITFHSLNPWQTLKSCSFLGGHFTDPGSLVLQFSLSLLLGFPHSPSIITWEKSRTKKPNRWHLSGWKSQHFRGMKHPTSHSSVAVTAQFAVLVEQGQSILCLVDIPGYCRLDCSQMTARLRYLWKNKKVNLRIVKTCVYSKVSHSSREKQCVKLILHNVTWFSRDYIRLKFSLASSSRIQ